MKLHLLNHIKKTDALKKIEEFVAATDRKNVKIIACAVMGHGRNIKQEIAEGDWLVH